MKKSFLLSILLALLALGLFSGCEGLLNQSPKTQTFFDSAKKAAGENYILVDSPSMTLGAEHAGKTAYLVKVNGGSSVQNAKDTGRLKSMARDAVLEDDFFAELEPNENFRGLLGISGKPIENVDIPFGAVQNISRDSAAVFGDTIYKLGDKRKFFVATAEKTREQRTATLKAIGSRCLIWYVPSQKSFIHESEMDFSKLAKKFDSAYDIETAIFGLNEATVNYSDVISVRSKDKVNFIVYDIFSDADENLKKSGVFGFFTPLDLFASDSEKTSNRSQLLNIDSWLFQNNPGLIYSTAVHEFQHLLNFVQKNMNTEIGSGMSVWFQEMLSTLSEEILGETIGTTLDDSTYIRLPWFATGGFYGFGSYSWNYFAGLDFSGTFDYGNTYTFGTYLMHNYGGIPLIHEIATNSEYEEKAISEALKTLGYTEENGRYEDFSTVLCKFGQIVANADGAAKNINTLNKSIAKDSNYNILVNKLDLSKVKKDSFSSYKKLVQNGIIPAQEKTQNKDFPYILYAKDRIPLLPYGISVHYLGKIGIHGSSYDFELPASSDIAMFILLK